MSSNSGSRRSGRGRSSDEYWDDDSYYDDDRGERSSGRGSSRGSAGRSSGNSRSGGNVKSAGKGSSSGHGRSSGKSRASGDSRRGRGEDRGRPHPSSRAAEEKRRRRREERQRRILLILAAVLILAAAVAALLAVTGNLGSTSFTESTMEFLENGKIRVTTVESFDLDYYDAEELEDTIKEAISEYGSGVDKEYLDVSNDTAKLVMTYDSAEDYVGFNGTDLFIGTIAQAEEAGYDFQSIMSAVSQEDTSKILTEATLDQLLENEVIILFEQVNVVTSEEILYATSNLGVTDSTHATAIDTISDDTPAIVILMDD